MAWDDVSRLREADRWLRESAAAAERVLPELLALPAEALARELRARPELVTPRLMQAFLRVAHDALERLPSRAHELTRIVLRHVPAMVVPPGLADVAEVVRGEAWREHANALRAIDRPVQAFRALAAARSVFAPLEGRDWYLATVDLIEASLLHDRGRSAEALAMIRRAGEHFARVRDDGNFLQARMLEIWMMRAAGDRARAADLWIATAAAAVRHGKTAMAGRFAFRMGVLEMQEGNPAEAMELFRTALDRLAKAGLRDEEIRARWHYAAAVAACGRSAEAVSEYFRVRAELLMRGQWIDSALATVDVLDLLHELRSATLASVADKCLQEFSAAGLPITMLEPLAYLRGRAEQESLTRSDLDCVRTFFKDLPQRPLSRFSAL